jgi:hypothetical protein
VFDLSTSYFQLSFIYPVRSFFSFLFFSSLSCFQTKEIWMTVAAEKTRAERTGIGSTTATMASLGSDRRLGSELEAMPAA